MAAVLRHPKFDAIAPPEHLTDKRVQAEYMRIKREKAAIERYLRSRGVLVGDDTK